MKETEILLDCLLWFRLHHDPPPPGSDAAVVWWLSAAADASHLAEKWEHHPLVMDLLCTLYAYREHLSREN